MTINLVRQTVVPGVTQDQMQDGTWRLKFNIRLAGTTNGGPTTTVNGVLVSYNQAVAMTSDSLNPAYISGFGFIAENNDTFYSRTGSGTSGIFMSGDIELTSKPSWAY